jgi:hypothetical protein
MLPGVTRWLIKNDKHVYEKGTEKLVQDIKAASGSEDNVGKQ